MCRAAWPVSFRPERARICRPIDHISASNDAQRAVLIAAAALTIDESTLRPRRNRLAERPPWVGVLDEFASGGDTAVLGERADLADLVEEQQINYEQQHGAEHQQHEDGDEEEGDEREEHGLRPFRGQLVEEAEVLRFFEANLAGGDTFLEQTSLPSSASQGFGLPRAREVSHARHDHASVTSEVALLGDISEASARPSEEVPVSGHMQHEREDRFVSEQTARPPHVATADTGQDQTNSEAGERLSSFGAPAPPLGGQEVSVVTDAFSQMQENHRLAKEARKRAEGELRGPLIGGTWRQCSDDARENLDQTRLPNRTRPHPGRHAPAQKLREASLLTHPSSPVEEAESDGAKQAPVDILEQYLENRAIAREAKLRAEGVPRSPMHAQESLEIDAARRAAEVRARARQERAAAEEEHLRALRQAAAEARRDARSVQQKMRELEQGPPATEQ